MKRIVKNNSGTPLAVIAILILAVFFSFTAIVGCSGGGGGGGESPAPTESPTTSPTVSPTPSPTVSPTPNDEAQIKEIINKNSTGIFGMEDVEGFETFAENVGPLKRQEPTEVSPHQRWYRYYTSFENDVDVDVQGDIANVTISRHWSGVLRLKIEEGSEVVEKPIDDVFTRNATFQKEGELWTLKRITPLVLKPYDGEQVVNIKKFLITQNDQTVIEITDPTLQLDVENLPVFSPQSNVRVEVEVEHLGSSNYTPDMHVFIHHGHRLIEGHWRNIAFDDGGVNPFSGDEVAGDNIYSRLYTTGLGSEYWKRGAADVLDSRCLHTGDDDYSSNVWVIPYKVETQ